MTVLVPVPSLIGMPSGLARSVVEVLGYELRVFNPGDEHKPFSAECRSDRVNVRLNAQGVVECITGIF